MLFVHKTLTPFLLATALATRLAAPGLAQAERSRTYLWGFQKECEKLADADRFVDKQLHAQGSEVWRLTSPQGTALPAVCPPGSGARCGQAVKGACPHLQGQLLGGSIVRGKDVTKFRLWLYDMQSGQVAYQDDYCQSCDFIAALAAQSQRLIAQPQFGNAPGPIPQYCGQASGATSSAPSALSGGPVHLVVYGEGKNKAGLFGALRAQIGLRGRPVLPVTIESKTYTSDVLQKIIAGNKDAQVVGVEVQREGKVGVFVFDGKTEQTADKVFECVDCAQSKDVLVARVQSEVAALLDRCFGEECGSSAHKSALSSEACEPFPEQACNGLDALMREIPQALRGDVGAPASKLTPSTARALKGLAWGGVALSAATSIGLFIANSTAAGTRINTRDTSVDNTLWYPAWSTAGLTIGLLGLAIPTTLIINRVTTESKAQLEHKANSSTSPSPIRCPE